MILDITFWAISAVAVFSGWRVFRADSMVRAAYWLLVSFAAVGVILVLMKAQFLGLILILMMGGEMTIMAVFMVAFMMNPAGLNPMTMVHRNRVAIAAGVVSFLAIAALGLFARFPTVPAPGDADPTRRLGVELLGDSMLVFQTAGVVAPRDDDRRHRHQQRPRPLRRRGRGLGGARAARHPGRRRHAGRGGEPMTLQASSSWPPRSSASACTALSASSPS